MIDDLGQGGLQIWLGLIGGHIMGSNPLLSQSFFSA